jgi:hypothetical protein
VRPGERHNNIREAFVVLDLIVAEFESDPMSVQCFDLRTVLRAKACIRKWKADGGTP